MHDNDEIFVFFTFRLFDLKKNYRESIAEQKKRFKYYWPKESKEE